jgi:hypothetical protein
MDKSIRRRAIPLSSLGLALVAFGSAYDAHAGCTSPDWSREPSNAPGLMSAVYHPSSDAFGLMTINLADDVIVGLWKFELLSKSTPNNTNPMPDGTLIDFGTAAWHSDGTELINSGIRNPADGDFCQGVWSRIDDSTFFLNHLALAWMNGSYVGPARITEHVTVGPHGDRYWGNFKIVQYVASITPGHEFDQDTAVATITGTVRATRIKAN